MLYRILRLLMKVTVKAFFRRYYVKNADRISPGKPLIIVANHPSTFMDPIIIAVAMKRKIYFIAKGEVFRSRFASWLLPKFNMIPIYRKEHDPALIHKNEEVFNKVYEILEKNGAVLIFPEGISLTDRKLKQLKSGASRMAIGAELRNNFTLGLEILPVGLNYSDPHRFQSDLFVNFDEPVKLSEFRDEARKDSFAASKILTNRIRESLEKQIVAIEDAGADELVSRIETIYRSKLLRELGYTSRLSENQFIVSRMISERVQYFLEKEPERVAKVRNLIDDYFRLLNMLHLEDKQLRNTHNSSWRDIFMDLIGFVIGFPLFLFGTANNYIPWRLPNIIAMRFTDRGEYVGAITMTAGTFTFLFFYTFQIWMIQQIFHVPLFTIVYALMLPVSGFFAYYYYKRLTLFRKKWKFLSLFMKHSRLVSELILKREKIIDELQKGRFEYDQLAEKSVQ